MGNILKACMAIADNPIVELVDYYNGRNRINNVGKALEIFIQDAFAETINETNEQVRLKKISQVYSYSGNQNNPPDLMLKGSDAIEVKKIQSKNSPLALNSSYPKAKIFASSPMITSSCKTCESWSEKDIIYAVGHTSNKKLKSLWLVYGDCYAADKEIYERIKITISKGLLDIPNVLFTKTKELGKIKNIDPLGITDLRIRGMWNISNPKKVFDYVYKTNKNHIFELISIIKKEKYFCFSQKDRSNIELSNLLQIKDIQIKDPNNPVNLIEAKMITFSM